MVSAHRLKVAPCASDDHLREYVARLNFRATLILLTPSLGTNAAQASSQAGEGPVKPGQNSLARSATNPCELNAACDLDHSGNYLQSLLSNHGAR